MAKEEPEVGGTLTETGSDLPSAPGMLEQGTAVGRYVVLSHLGSGGMGVVYVAYDPELDRKVAVKLLHGRSVSADADQGRTRMLREAQALGRLSHPNVVAVYDVGTLGRRIWLAMEFIEGDTLKDWQRAEVRGWREVLDVFVQAGRGLVAAHDKGLVHRDFKPANVMVSPDGRVRVMDFGLARTERSVAAATPKQPRVGDIDVTPSESALGAEMTKDGALVGTPAYMAPESHLGFAVDAGSDQFSFCVSFWEALYGERPFAGDTLPEIATATMAGRRRPAPAKAAVPPWLRKVVERGLAAAPEERWPSMQALLEGLRAGARRRRRRVVGAAVVGVLSIGVAVEGGRQWEHAENVEMCEEQSREIHETWNEVAKASVRAALVGTGVSYAESTADHLVPFVDAFAADWETAKMHWCRASFIDNSYDFDTMERSRDCLREARWALEETVAVLSEAHAGDVQRAVSMTGALPEVDACVDTARLAFRPRAPAHEATRKQVADVRRELQRASSLKAAGRYAESYALGQELATRAEQIGWLPLRAQMKIALGNLAIGAGELKVAETLLEEGLLLAAEAGSERLMAEAAGRLGVTVGDGLSRPDEGIRWGRLAVALTSHMGQDGDLKGAEMQATLGNSHHAKGSYDEALRLASHAIAIEEKILGPRHPGVADSLINIGLLHYERGANEDARALDERALWIYEIALGPEHPDVARCLNNLAVVHYALGEPERTAALLRRALEIREDALGRDHPDVAASLTNLANIHQVRGELDEADPLLERALGIYQDAFGTDHPSVAPVLSNMAHILQQRESYDEAEKLYRRSLQIYKDALGPEHAEVGRTTLKLAELHEGRGDHELAAAAFEQARVIFEDAFGASHPELAQALEGVGRTALAQGRPNQALAPLARAVQIHDETDAPEDVVADTRGLLARAQSESGSD